MSEIDDMQRRIMAALQRIGSGIETLAARSEVPPKPVDQGPSAGQSALEEALEEEKLANAQLEERLRTLRARHAEEIAALHATEDDGADWDKLRAELDAQQDAMAGLDKELQRLRQANDQLRDSNEALRRANETSVGAPELINKALEAEIEGLRAARATDLAEANAVLAKLEPLLAGAPNLPEGEEL
ncbi:hypothetical protein [Pontibaca salina]|uniref:Colicin transporter n=1 Tax=Pontibaca salina TaxID=2795731 RepID=A0A934HR12_9RHOB|nr:hypothetical protein [Pontibaca salina]MBI6628995.1 hypothetical protein [Pontibaca salina]